MTRAGAPAGRRVGRADLGRADQAHAGPAAGGPVRGIELLVDTGVADVVLPEVPRLRLETDEHFRHKDVYLHSLTVLDAGHRAGAPVRPGAGPRAAAGRAAARHRQAEDPGEAAGRPGGLPPSRGEGRGHGPGPADGAALPGRRRGRRVPPGRAAPAVPRVRRRGVDGLGGPPLRPGRGPAADPAARADPGGLHHPEQGQGGTGWPGPTTAWRSASPCSARRRNSRRSGRTWTATRSCGSSACRPGREVGRAYQYLLELRMEHGPLGPERATQELLALGRGRRARAARPGGAAARGRLQPAQQPVRRRGDRVPGRDQRR